MLACPNNVLWFPPYTNFIFLGEKKPLPVVTDYYASLKPLEFEKVSAILPGAKQRRVAVLAKLHNENSQAWFL